MLSLLLLLYSACALANTNLTCPFTHIRQLSANDVANYSVNDKLASVEFINLITPLTKISIEDYFYASLLPNKGKFLLTDDFVFTGFATEGVDYASNIYYVSEFTISIINSDGTQDNLLKSYNVDTPDEVYFPLYPLIPTRDIRLTINNFTAPHGFGYYWRMRFFGCSEADAIEVTESTAISCVADIPPSATITPSLITPSSYDDTTSSQLQPAVVSPHELTIMTTAMPQIPTAFGTTTAAIRTTINTCIQPIVSSTDTGDGVTSTSDETASVSVRTIIITSYIIRTSAVTVADGASGNNCSTDQRGQTTGAVSSNGAVSFVVLGGIVVPLLVLIIILVIIIGAIIIYNHRRKVNASSKLRMRPRSGTVKEVPNLSLYASHSPIAAMNPYTHVEMDGMISNQMYEGFESSGAVLVNDEYSTIEEAKEH